MILMPSDYDPGGTGASFEARKCQMPAILLWMPNGLVYIYIYGKQPG